MCNAKDLVVIQSRLKNLMKIDANVNQDNEYNIKSLYLDTYANTCYYDNQSGVDSRKKYRVRIYDDNEELIKLEIKSKNYSYISKESTNLSKEEVNTILKKRFLPFKSSNDKTYTKVATLMRTQMLKPVVIVEYVREPYVYKQGNVRITLDKHITASKYTESFLSKTKCKRQLLETGQFVLEVKYDQFLPSHIYNALGLKNMTKTSFSKYNIARDTIKETFLG